MRSLRNRQSGFTLAELLVGLVVTSIVLAATTAIFMGVQNAYQAETESKVITENGRAALVFLERVVPLAGYGIDPRLAFDRRAANNVDNSDVKAETFTGTGSGTAMVGPTNTIVTDSLALRFRDPAFLRVGRLDSAASPSTLTVDTAFGVAFPVGTLMMVMCQGGVDYVMVRTTGTVSGSSVSVAAQTTDPFVANTNSCLEGTGSVSPYVFFVQEHRLRIVNIAGRPWLVSFRNLNDSPLDLSKPYDPIAPDVENFQVAFGMNRARPALGFTTPPDGAGGNWVMGDATSETLPTQSANILTTKPDYRTPYDDSTRYTASVANVRSVHLAMVLRTSRTNPQKKESKTSTSFFNYTAPAQTTSLYDRAMFHTVINVPNMWSRTGFVPSLRTSSDLRDLNSWGG